uniref:ABC transporter C family member 10 n=1 Tax=Lygus hesperus TaxID=30085 RepID=A0A0A9XJT7_LYGHE
MNISLGQKQLICMCRVLLRKPRILLLDEATSSIDSKTDQYLQNIIETRFASSTVITVAHRLNTIMKSDMVLVISKGRAVEYGHPIDLLRGTGILSKEVEESVPQGPVIHDGQHMFANMYRSYIQYSSTQTTQAP